MQRSWGVTKMNDAQVRLSGEAFQGAVSFLKALAAAGQGRAGDGVERSTFKRSTLEGWLDTDAATWLRAQGLGPYAFYRLREAGEIGALPAAAEEVLRGAYYRAVADTVLHDRELAVVLDALAAVGITPILFKGAVLAHTAYPDPACRSMGDLDLWLTDSDPSPGLRVMARGQAALEAIGYVQRHKPTRPIALMVQRSGEIQMIGQHPGSGLVELHWGTFAGEWLRRSAAVDEALIREQVRPVIILGRPARSLAPEDAIIQLAVHLAVNHQMAYPGLRGLLDLVLLARAGDVDWAEVTARAKSWRVGTATWLVLHLAADLFGLDEAAPAIAHLRPSSARRWWLGRFASARSLLALRDLTRGPLRFVYQLLLVDRARDALRLFWRAVWPEDDWLAARYGQAGSGVRLRHLLGAVRGRV